MKKSLLRSIGHRKWLLYFSTLILLFSILNSCKKSDENLQESLNLEKQKKIDGYLNGPKLTMINLDQFRKRVSPQSIGVLSQIFNKKPSSNGIMAINTSQTYNGFSLNIDSIKVLQTDGHTSYIFSVVLASPSAVTFQNLTIDISTSGTIAFVNTYTPTKKWINDWKTAKPGKFDGKINVTYLDLGNGLPSFANSVASKKNSNSVQAAQACYSTTYYYTIPYSCGSGAHMPGNTECTLSGSSAAGYVYVSNTITECYDVPDPNGGGGGGTTPSPPPNYDPCGANVPPSPPSVSNKPGSQSKIMIVQPPSDNPCDTPEPPADIKDKLSAYPCAQSLVTQMSTLKGDIANLINTIFGKSDVRILLFEANPRLVGTTIDGNYAGFSGLTNGSVGTYKVGLNPDVLNNASKEYILVTLYHEALHAYLDFKSKQLGPTEFSRQFEGLSVNGGRTLFTEVNGHFSMAANNYINGLRDAILSFNPSYNIDRATALAQGGIVNLSATNAAVNKQERDTTKSGYTGTKCP